MCVGGVGNNRNKVHVQPPALQIQSKKRGPRQPQLHVPRVSVCVYTDLRMCACVYACVCMYVCMYVRAWGGGWGGQRCGFISTEDVSMSHCRGTENGAESNCSHGASVLRGQD